MTTEQIQQAIDNKIPILINNSYMFYNKPTIILSFCGNPDFVKVEGSDDSYEIWRLRMVDQISVVTKNVSVLVGKHLSDCTAVKLVNEKYAPFEWNVLNFNKVLCNDNGEEISMQNGSLWYEFSCGDKKCECKKRIKASAIALL